MKSLVAIVIACALGSSASGQAPAVPADPAKKPPGGPVVETVVVEEPEADGPEKIIGRFFSYLQRREVDQAYDQLTRETKIAERPEDVKTLKAKTKEAITVFGPILGYEHVAKKNVGDRLASYTIISLGKEFPLRWRFYFYKPADVWRLIDLRVDDRLAAVFDEPEDARAREERP
ncbi:MAG: hypothetical protein ABMA01_17225 [Chthoniobacteraceae bacterium]